MVTSDMLQPNLEILNNMQKLVVTYERGEKEGKNYDGIVDDKLYHLHVRVIAIIIQLFGINSPFSPYS